MHRALVFVFLVFALPAMGAEVPSGVMPPQCKCSKGVVARFGLPARQNEVYVANCRCEPQTCAVTWSTKSKYAGVQLACTLEPAAADYGNCLDFTQLENQKIGVRKRWGIFTITPPPSTTPGAEAEIASYSLIDSHGIEIGGPQVLRSAPTVGVGMATKVTRVEITYIAGQPGGAGVTWLNEKGEPKNVRFGQTVPEFKFQKVSIKDLAGFRSFNLESIEYGYMKFCAFTED